MCLRAAGKDYSLKKILRDFFNAWEQHRTERQDILTVPGTARGLGVGKQYKWEDYRTDAPADKSDPKGVIAFFRRMFCEDLNPVDDVHHWKRDNKAHMLFEWNLEKNADKSGPMTPAE